MMTFGDFLSKKDRINLMMAHINELEQCYNELEEILKITDKRFAIYTSQNLIRCEIELQQDMLVEKFNVEYFFNFDTQKWQLVE